jgi:predicted NAD/FAD-binding protein
MRIGIVGTGIAGLTAGWLFKQAGFCVTLFEKHHQLGMDAHAVGFQVNSQEIRADIPPRMFNSSLWPTLSRLYSELGVEKLPVAATKSFGRFGDTQGLFKLGDSYRPAWSVGWMLDPRMRRIVKDIKRMVESAPRDLKVGLGDTTMGSYLADNRYSIDFKSLFLYPSLSSTVCTCSFAALDDYPAEILLDTLLKLTSGEGLFRTRFGTADVERRLTLGLDEIRLGADICSIRATDTTAQIETAAGETFAFEHVIVATQANSAIGLLPATAEREIAALSRFRYQDVAVSLHRDTRLMPARNKDRAAFNFLTSATNDAAMCTIDMSKFCPEWQLESPIFQTIMPLESPTPDSVIGSAKMQRPVVDQASLAGVTELERLHQNEGRRIWFSGSYASLGVPLLESGVVSSLNVAKRLGVEWPARS